MPFEERENPPWSWSVSRRGCFRECLRRYFYQYYGYHEGWRPGAAEAARLAYRLKHLKSLPILVGEVLHEIFGMTLAAVRGGAALPAADALFQEARRRMNRAWAESRNRKAFEADPKRHVMLHELYYGPEPGDSRIDAMRARLEKAIRGFLDSRSLREAASAPFQEIKGIDHEGHFDLDGSRVYAAPDLTYRLGDGSHTIVDWKTGADSDEHAVQIGVYALYLRHRHKVAGEIRGRLEYVTDARGEDVVVDAGALDAAEREIRDSMSAMRGYLHDPATNRPRGRDAFPLRDDRAHCPSCGFYELCRPEIEGSAPPGPF